MIGMVWGRLMLCRALIATCASPVQHVFIAYKDSKKQIKIPNDRMNEARNSHYTASQPLAHTVSTSIARAIARSYPVHS